ncbi:sensor histidine kinase [Aegicerativicinus sediminis]|uniref:sensor histidine kinase n=1 Tax=Aegicerativicinus sediminis TaxID=2893202 RepID=UPI001E642B1C|nr:histidine kinase [Aegicerativicinus sediminis]
MKLRKFIDWRLIAILAVFYTLFDLVYIGKGYLLSMLGFGRDGSTFGTVLLGGFVLDWIVVICFMTLIAISTKYFIRKRKPWSIIIAVHILGSIFIGFLIRLISDFNLFLNDKLHTGYELKRSLAAFIAVLDLNFLIYFAMVGIIYTFYYVKQVRESEQRRIQVEDQLTETKLKLLNSKLQPHFLFNTLNTISSLMSIDTQKAQNTISDLSSFLRDILYTKSTTIKLRKELEVLNTYLEILHTRFGDHLNIEKEINPSCLKLLVPPLIIQPIIENAVKHGYSPQHSSLTIKLIIKCNSEYLQIRVWNNGAAIDTSKDYFNSGVGLKNTKDRLETLYQDNFEFYLQNSADGEGVETFIEIPRLLFKD